MVLYGALKPVTEAKNVSEYTQGMPQHSRGTKQRRDKKQIKTKQTPHIITKTCLYNVDPLKSHLYTVKLELTGVYIIFLISVQNIDRGYSLEPPRRGGSNEYP